MQKSILNITTAFALCIVILSGCKKDDPDPTDPGPATGGNFTWTPAGGTAIVADDAYYLPAYSNILGFKNGNSNTVDITISDLTPGTYAISASLGNTLEYSVGTTTYTGKSGSVKITSNTNSKLSGNFTASLAGGTLTGLSGEFTDLPAH